MKEEHGAPSLMHGGREISHQLDAIARREAHDARLGAAFLERWLLASVVLLEPFDALVLFLEVSSGSSAWHAVKHNPMQQLARLAKTGRVFFAFTGVAPMIWVLLC